MKLRFRSALALAIVFPASLQSQRIKVAVSIQDSATGRVFQGAFASAFRSLGDVDLVTLAERPRYVISGVVLCEPASCQNPTYYTAALRFWSPMDESTGRLLALRATPRIPAATYMARADSLFTSVVWPMLVGYEETHTTWAAEWGRSRYEQSVRELVRLIDTDCFERTRAWNRAASTTDTAAIAAINRAIDARTWLC